MRTKQGIVTSAKMTGTVIVTVQAFVLHPVYQKQVRRSKKFFADTNGHDLHEGDVVLIGECRPLSKKKRFKVMEILKQAPRVDEVTEEEDVEKAIHREKQAPEGVKEGEETQEEKRRGEEEKKKEEPKKKEKKEDKKGAKDDPPEAE